MIKISEIIITFKGLFGVNFKNFFKKFKKFNAYNNLDKKMLKYLDYQNGFYIDCGANDGINQSTTWFYEKNKNWKGMLIEPIPSTFDNLKKNRGKGNIFANVALVSNAFKKENLEIYFNTKDTLIGSALNNKRNQESAIVKAITLSKLLEDQKIQKNIDFFSLDVEGYEFEVLEGIDFKEFKFKYILVETSNPQKLHDLLLMNDYTFVERLSNFNFKDFPEYGDYLYKNNDNTI